jgi:hypothetical protein
MDCYPRGLLDYRNEVRRWDPRIPAYLSHERASEMDAGLYVCAGHSREERCDRSNVLGSTPIEVGTEEPFPLCFACNKPVVWRRLKAPDRRQSKTARALAAAFKPVLRPLK